MQIFHAMRGHATRSFASLTRVKASICRGRNREERLLLGTLTADARMTWCVYKRKIDRASTYESWAFAGHSVHLCSIRRTHYCSLENSISNWDRVQGTGYAISAISKVSKTAPYPARQARARSQGLGWSKTYRRASHETA
jgi:hypothetical protein